MDIAHYLIQHYGYLGIFAILMLGMFGIPFPDETVLAFSGFLASLGYLRFLPALAVAYVGSITGITMNYVVGRTLGWQLVKKYGPLLHFTDAKIEEVSRWFDRRGKWALAMGYFFPGLRHLAAFTAGASRLPARVFVLFAYVGGFFWTLTIISLGYFLGEEWVVQSRRLRAFFFLALGIALLGVALYLIWDRVLKRR